MKRTTLIFSMLCCTALLFMWSCKKGDNPGGGGNGGTVITDEFTMKYTDEGAFPANAQMLFDLAPVGFKVEAYSGNFPSNVDATLTAKGTSKDKVISIVGDSLRVTINNNPGQNLDFMDSIWVYVSKVDGTSRFLFGSKFNYNMGLRQLNLNIENSDVKEVFSSDSVKLSLWGTKRAGSHTIQPNTIIEFRASVVGTFDITP